MKVERSTLYIVLNPSCLALSTAKDCWEKYNYIGEAEINSDKKMEISNFTDAFQYLPMALTRVLQSGKAPSNTKIHVAVYGSNVTGVNKIIWPSWSQK